MPGPNEIILPDLLALNDSLINDDYPVIIEKVMRVARKACDADGCFFFSVSDNGDGIATEELAHLQDYIAGSNSDYTSIGLRNTHCRLELFFGKPYGLSIRSVPGRGTSVTLRMPLMHKPFA